jgi:hypothetical protein
MRRVPLPAILVMCQALEGGMRFTFPPYPYIMKRQVGRASLPAKGMAVPILQLL